MLGEPDAPAAKPGEKGRSDPTFDMLLQIMDGSTFLGSIVRFGVNWIGSNPQLQAMTKFMLIEALGNLTSELTEVKGLPEDMKKLLKVLIEARNQKVIADLKTELKTVPADGSIAIFYGTGHMGDMEKRVLREFNYKFAAQEWLTAFSVDVRDTGMSAGEIEWTRNLIKSQMEQMRQ